MQIPFVWGKLLNTYSKSVVDDPELQLGEPAWLTPLIQAAIFRRIRDSKQRHCYKDLGIFNAGKGDDLAKTIDLIYNAAEDAPLSIVIIGVGNRDFSAIES